LCNSLYSVNTSFHDLQFDLAEERAETLYRDAGHYWSVQEARRARSRRRRRLGLWRRAIAAAELRERIDTLTIRSQSPRPAVMAAPGVPV
jgi:hypothetical protein